jgi:hypothetical protein
VSISRGKVHFDVTTAERRYAEVGNNIGKLEAEISGLRAKLGNIRGALAAWDSETDPNEIPDYPTGIISLELNRARLALNNARFAFELGSLSKNDFANAENNLKSLLYKYLAEAEDLELNLTGETDGFGKSEAVRRGHQGHAQGLPKQREHKSSGRGIILNLSVEKGKYFPENAFLVSIGVGREFFVECNIFLENNFVNPGDVCELSNAGHVLNGTVRRIKPTAQGKTVTVSVISGEVSDGETFDVTFEKNSAASFTLVPKSAINQDNDGYFLYQIKRRKGIMGDEYYLERLDIFSGDSDRRNTAVIRGIAFFEPIVLASSKALSAGNTVTLKNPEDFLKIKVIVTASLALALSMGGLCIPAYLARWGRDLFLAFPAEHGSPRIGIQKIENFIEDEFLLTYEIIGSDRASLA